MAASGFTLVQLYRTATPGSVPLAANLSAGELAINTSDEKLFFKNAGGSVVEFSGGFSYTTVKTANYAAQVGEGVQTNTTGGAFTVTLPATPASGDQVIITDAAESWGVNNLTVARNGSLIEGIASDLICNISGVAITLIYTGTSWQVYAQAGGAGGIIDINTQTTGTLGVARGGTGATTLTANAVVIGNGTSAVTAVAPGTTGNVLTSNGTIWASTALPSNAVAYPQNIQSANYTLVLSDAGKQIFHPVADANIRTYTIPANSSVAFPIGTVVLFTVENGGRYVNVACGDTLVFGSGITGSVAVTANNTLMAIKVTSTKWMANYLYQTGGAATAETIAVAHTTSPFITAYPWNISGFGTKFTDPGTLPSGNGQGVAFTAAGDAIAVADNSSPFIAVYPWSISGFGTKFANPATLPTGFGSGVAFSPSGNAIAVTHGTTPFITAYPWSGSGFGTKFTDPATLPVTQGNDVVFSPAGDAIAVAFFGSPYVNAYPWSGSGFGTKFTNPATLPTGSGNDVAFSPAGDAIAVAHTTSPNITAYPWSISGFGTKFTDPGTLPAGDGNGVAFSPAGDAIAVAHGTTPFITAYPWSISGFGTKFTDPATLPTGNGQDVAFTAAGDAIAVAHSTSPFITAYPWSGSGFGTKFTNPATLPAGTGRNVAFTINS
jgi:hypothetical protein